MSKKDKSIKELDKVVKKFFKDIDKDIEELFDKDGMFGSLKGKGKRKIDKAEEIKVDYRIK